MSQSLHDSPTHRNNPVPESEIDWDRVKVPRRPKKGQLSIFADSDLAIGCRFLADIDTGERFLLAIRTLTATEPATESTETDAELIQIIIDPRKRPISRRAALERLIRQVQEDATDPHLTGSAPLPPA